MSLANFGLGILVSCNASYRHKYRGCGPEQKGTFAAEFSRPSPRQGPRNSARNFGYGILLALLACKASGDGGPGSAAQAEGAQPLQEVELLNVSYDPTRELWREVNAKF